MVAEHTVGRPGISWYTYLQLAFGNIVVASCNQLASVKDYVSGVMCKDLLQTSTHITQLGFTELFYLWLVCLTMLFKLERCSLHHIKLAIVMVCWCFSSKATNYKIHLRKLYFI